MIELTAGTIMLSIVLTLALAVWLARPVPGIVEAVPVWQTLAEERGWSCRSPDAAPTFHLTPVLDAVIDGVKVSAEVIPDGKGVRTRVRSVRFGEPRDLTGLPVRAGLRKRARDGIVEVSWPGVERDPEVLAAAVVAVAGAWRT